MKPFIPALSIRQPFATLITSGTKTFDPRTVGWVLSDVIAFPSLIPYPGRLNLFPVPTDSIPEEYQYLLEEVTV